MAIAFMGIDLAKSVFQLHSADSEGRLIMSKRLRRDQLLPELAKLPACVIGIEACTGAFFWQRQFETLGHTVRITAPQYMKHHKNDRNDAEAICMAMRQPNMKPAEYEVCAGQERRATGHSGASSRPHPFGEPPHRSCQLVARALVGPWGHYRRFNQSCPARHPGNCCRPGQRPDRNDTRDHCRTLRVRRSGRCADHGFRPPY